MLGWGLVAECELERIVVVSPHLDDAVLGCGQLLSAHPGAVVITVFAGNPDAYPVPQRPWDVISGFVPDDDVMAARRAEDISALSSLGAIAHHLDFVEHSYNEAGNPVSPTLIAPTLADAIASHSPTSVIIPFGLANPDHGVTHDAATIAREGLGSELSWFAYEDMGYNFIPGMLAWRVSELFRSNLWPTKASPSTDQSWDRKLAAIEHYPSQLLALEHDWNLSLKLASRPDEAYWRLEQPPQGWESLSAR